MTELKHISKIGIAIGCYCIISGIAALLSIGSTLLNEAKFDDDSAVCSITTLIDILASVFVSALMIYGILKRRRFFLATWLICNGVTTLRIVFRTVHLYAYIHHFYMYTFDLVMDLTGELIVFSYCIWIVYKEMHLASIKQPQAGQNYPYSILIQ